MVRTPSRWAQVGQGVVFVLAIGAAVAFGRPHDPASLGEALGFLLTIFVLLRFPNLRRFKAPGGLEIEQLDVREELSAAEEEAQAVRPLSPPAAPPHTKGPPAQATTAPQPDEDPRWRRCGNVYWVANDTVFAAFALAQGDLVAAMRGCTHAINHAKQIPMAPELLKRLRALKQQILIDSDERRRVVGDLLKLATEMGAFISEHDPGFPLRDIHDES